MTSRSETPLCPHCGAKMVEYPHLLSKYLVRALAKLAIESGTEPYDIRDLKLSKSEYTNFSKLKYWGLAEPANETGSERGGRWRVTDKGIAFCSGVIKLPKRLWSYRGEVVRIEEDFQVSIDDLTDRRWRYKPDYARERRPHVQ